MDSVASLNKKIADYVDQLNTKQKRVVLSVAKAFVEEGVEHDVWDDEDFVREMDKRVKELESGKVKGYTWDEVKKSTRQALSEIKRK